MSIYIIIIKRRGLIMMYLDFSFMVSDDNVIEKRVSPYELTLFLKSYPEGSYSSVLETVWNQYGIIEDYFNEEEETWYSGFSMPPTWWLIKSIRAEYGPDHIWIKIPESLLGLVESVKQAPKRRWRLYETWKKKNSKFHQPWWMN